MATSRRVLVNYAKKWEGVKGGSATHLSMLAAYNSLSPLPRNYKVQPNDSWCAMFVSFCAKMTENTDIIPVECSCQRMIEKAKSMGIWQENENYKPSIGDIVLFDWQDNGVGDNKGWADHVGIVTVVYENSFETIEGNNGNKVAGRTLPINGRFIRGFIVPKYNDNNNPSATNPSATNPSATNPSTPTEKIIQEVINGKWGRGEDRRNRLTNAGYDWKAIQNEVNRRLGSSKRY